MTSRTVTYEFQARQSLTAAFQQTQKDVNATGQAMGSLSQRISATVSDQDKLRLSVRETGNEYTRLRDQANAYAAQQRAIAAEARALHAQAGGSGGGGGSSFLGGLVGGAAGFVGTQVLGSAVGVMKDLSGQSLELAGNLELTRGAFTSLLGSAQAADQELGALRAFSDKAPLFDTENTQHFALMLAGAGEQAKRLVPDLKEIGAVTAGTGGGTQQLQEVALAYSQVLTQGRLMGQEALQFANANVPIWRIVAEGLGVSTAKAKELTTEGKITADVFQQAFSSYAIAHFSDALVNAGNSFQGLQAQVASGWQNALTTFGTGLEQGVKPVLADIANTLQDPRTLEQIKQWGIAAGQFVGQLWEGAKVVAGWIGIKLPEVPQAPDYSALKLDTGAVSTNLQAGAGAATDFTKQIKDAQGQVARLRTAQTAADAQTTNAINRIRDAQTTQDREYEKEIQNLQDAGKALDRNYEATKRLRDLEQARGKLANDSRLAGDIFSNVGQAARERLLEDRNRVRDLGDEIQHANDKATNEDAITGRERTKQGYDQTQQDTITGLERARTAQDQLTQSSIQGLEAMIRQWQDLDKGIDSSTKIAGDDIRDRYQGAFTSVKTAAQATADDITTRYQGVANGDGITGPPASGLFTKLLGTLEQQQAAGTELANNVIFGFLHTPLDWKNWMTASFDQSGAAGIAAGLGSDLAKQVRIGLGLDAPDTSYGTASYPGTTAGVPDSARSGVGKGGDSNETRFAQAGGQAGFTANPTDPDSWNPLSPHNPVGQYIRNVTDIGGQLKSAGDAISGLFGGGSAAPAPGQAGFVGPVRPPGRAAGGAVTPGWYTVGERGPEWLHAGGTGQVVPSGGGRAPINITVNGFVGNEAQLAAKIGEILSLNAPGWQGWGA